MPATELPAQPPPGAVAPAPLATRALVVGALSSLALVLAFMAGAPVGAVWALAAGVTACGVVLQLRAPALALVLLPAPLLLGPIARVQLSSNASFNLGDLFLLGLVAGAYVRDGAGIRFDLGRHAMAIGAVMVLTFISWLRALDVVASGVTMLSLLELFVVFVLTTRAVREPADAERVLLGWLGAVTVSSVLVIWSYVVGKPLLLDSGGAAAARALATQTSQAYLYRASFFVTGFAYPLAAAIVIGTVFLAMAQGRRLAALGVVATSLLVNVLALVLMGANKTAGGAAAAGIALTLVWLGISRGHRRRALALAVTMTIAAALVGLLVRRLMPGAQYALLLGSFSAGDSFRVRLQLWHNVAAYLSGAPLALLFGLGPDATVRSGANPLVLALFRNWTGMQEGAVDNGYLYVVLNYGLGTLAVLVAIAFASLGDLARSIRRRATAGAIALWVCLAVWAVMAVTQQATISKPVFMLAQAVALAEVFSLGRARLARGAGPLPRAGTG